MSKAGKAGRAQVDVDDSMVPRLGERLHACISCKMIKTADQAPPPPAPVPRVAPFRWGSRGRLARYVLRSVSGAVSQFEEQGCNNCTHLENNSWPEWTSPDFEG